MPNSKSRPFFYNDVYYISKREFYKKHHNNEEPLNYNTIYQFYNYKMNESTTLYPPIPRKGKKKQHPRFIASCKMNTIISFS
jgi:hypothetical protein